MRGIDKRRAGGGQTSGLEIINKAGIEWNVSDLPVTWN